MSSAGPFAWLRGLVGARSRPQTSLFAAEALELARVTATRAGVTDDLEIMGVRQVEGRSCWVVGTATKDASWTVIVDDATGIAGDPEAWNGWST